MKDELNCALCNRPLLDEHGDGHFAEIRRGYYRTATTQAGDNDSVFYNLKAHVFLCNNCYLTDPVFCSFMNKIGMRIR